MHAPLTTSYKQSEFQYFTRILARSKIIDPGFSLTDEEYEAISKHLANIYETGELQRQTTISILETVQQEGNRYPKIL